MSKKKHRPLRIIREEIRSTISSLNKQKQNLIPLNEELERRSKSFHEQSQLCQSGQNVINHLKQRISKLQDEERDVSNSINRSSIVSDHALIRYLERVEGIDMEVIKKKIVGPNVNKIKKMETGRIERECHTLVIENSTVVTIMEKK